MMNLDTLKECPNCGFEFMTSNPKYSFCSWNCYTKYMARTHAKFNGVKWLTWALWEFDLCYVRPMNYHPRHELEEIEDEFNRLMRRDAI